MEDDGAIIEHKLNEMRVNMYYDPDVDVIFYLSQDSVTEEEESSMPFII